MPVLIYSVLTCCFVHIKIGIKSNKVMMVHLVATPARLKPSQAGLDSWGLLEFLVLFVHVIVRFAID